jgi:hypothetical protein
MSALGHSRPGRIGCKSGNVRYGAESGNKSRALAAAPLTRRGAGGFGAGQHAARPCVGGAVPLLGRRRESGSHRSDAARSAPATSTRNRSATAASPAKRRPATRAKACSRPPTATARQSRQQDDGALAQGHAGAGKPGVIGIVDRGRAVRSDRVFEDVVNRLADCRLARIDILLA